MTYDRTPYEAGLDIDYAIELHARHIKLYKHLRWLCSLVFLVSGMAVFSKVGATEHANWIGAVVALVAILDHLIAPSSKVAQHADLKRRWCDLRSDKDKLKLDAIDKRISVLTGEDIHIISALEKPSYNANLRRHGRELHVRKLSIWEWFVAALA